MQDATFNDTEPPDFPAELERKQDEVLQQLDELNANILALLDEFSSRLSLGDEENDDRRPHAA